jgi:hypothetical protein
MIRVVEAVKAGVTVNADQDVVLEFSDADLKAQVTSEGFWKPQWGVLKNSAGTVSAIKKMVCRRKEAPDATSVLIFKSTTGLSPTEFNDMIAYNTVGLDLPKFPALGGYEIVLTLTLAGATATITLLMKGTNAFPGEIGTGMDPGNLAHAAASGGAIPWGGPGGPSITTPGGSWISAGRPFHPSVPSSVTSRPGFPRQ